METIELFEIIARGEDSEHQFKEDIHNPESLAAELVAFANTRGGYILIGVRDDGTVAGLGPDDVRRLNELISNVASQGINPPINPKTQNVLLPDGLVLALSVLEGVSKPYMDKNGTIWVKSGADKRKATSREEIQRMYQSSGLIHGDEIPAKGMGVGDIDLPFFSRFVEETFDERIESLEIGLPTLLSNMNLMSNETLNVAGAMLFARIPQARLPIFVVKCIAFPGADMHESSYLDSQDCAGKISELFEQSLAFVLRNLRRPQGEQSVNSEGILEIPRIVFEELIANAVIHRDYFVSAPIRIFIYSNRIEIVSPGHLPNNLTIENIKNGNSNIRNPILASYATKILPYRGLGSGIRRALRAWPNINFIDDRDGNQFKVEIGRQ